MTNEEAIKKIEWFKDYNEDDYCGGDRIKDEYGDFYYKVTDEDFEAFGHAVEALRAVESGDAISRSAALKEAYNVTIDGEHFKVIQQETLLGLPCVIPVPKRFALISVTRDELEICVSYYETEKAAREAMIEDIILSTEFESLDEIIEAADAGICGFSDRDAWAETNHQGTGQWNIEEID